MFLRKRQHLPIFLQTEFAECGLACLAMISVFHGHDVNIQGLRRRFQPSSRGVNLKQLIDIAAKLHFNSRPLKFEAEDLRNLQIPCILHWDLDHFVVLQSVQRSRVTIHDPAFGIKHLNFAEFRKHCTGVALEVKPANSFQQIQERPRVRFRQLFDGMGFAGNLAQVVLLSLILMALALSLPIFVQLLFDDVLGSGDRQLLPLVIAGFLAVTVFRSVASGLRGLLLLFMGKVLMFHASASIFGKLLRLPLAFFERRHIGDVVSRFSSLEQVKRFMTEGMVEVIVDGFMTILMLALMFVYSAKLSLITLLAVTIYAALRLLTVESFRRLSEEVIVNQAREQSNFLETLRGIQSIKLYAGENERNSLWQNIYSRVLNANTSVGHYRIGFQGLQDFIFGLQKASVLYWGILLVLDSKLSAGMLIAFLSYQDQFAERIRSFIENGLQFKMLDLHLDRVADIVLQDEDPSDPESSSEQAISGAIELRSVSFRYDDQSQLVFDRLNAKIKAGESVAIAGASGCGKTTLLKIMTGLFQPAGGEVLIDGENLRQCRKVFQSMVATVMQDDHLLSGSIADNIAFFDSDPDFARIQKCASYAAMHDEIMKLPMRYNSLIGDMGSTLSGGQKQRILLARALYRQPRILFLDEATSHLDKKTEAAVNAAISRLSITRVVIAHRLETLMAADRILVLDEGLKDYSPEAYLASRG